MFASRTTFHLSNESQKVRTMERLFHSVNQGITRDWLALRLDGDARSPGVYP
jgi:hypothetical protein